eukprot:gene13107-13235_t
MPGVKAASTAAASPKLLLEHLRMVLARLDSEATGEPQLAAAERVVASKVAVLRAIASLYQPLMDTDCVELPLLLLLEQIASEHAQVSAAALELLQHLALQHTRSKELEELLLEGPAGVPLLTYVGKALHTQPQLFVELAAQLKVHEAQLAAAVTPHVVPWLCQNMLKEPLELLASKLGLAASSLFIGCADSVIAHALWFSLDQLEQFTEFVEQIVQPETFIAVVKACGRKIARWVIYMAGQPDFWTEQFSPADDLMSRAKQYIGILANAMELDPQQGMFELLQGETIALLLKSTGAALSKPMPEVAASSSNGSPAGQQLQRHGGVSGGHTVSSIGDGSSTRALALERDEVAAEKLQCLRALVVLMHLLGADLGSHAYQLMAVLSEALLYCKEGKLRMQALSAWMCFVQLLAQEAPQVLERVAAQSAVVLLPVLELASHTEGKASTSSAAAAGDVVAYGAPLEVDASAVQLAADVLHEIVVKQRHHVRPALQAMPPLPSLEVLQEVNAVLAQEQHLAGPLQQLQLLMQSLRHESLAVRHAGLGELRSFLSKCKNFMSDTLASLMSCAGPAALPGTTITAPAAGSGSAGPTAAATKLTSAQSREVVSELLAALLASCDNLPRSAQAEAMKQRCAQCLGVLGAIDPAHVAPELPRPAPFSYTPQGCLVSLVTQHLVRVLQTASDTGQLEATSYAIQQILQHYNRQRLEKAALAMQSFCEGSMSMDVEDEQAAAAEDPSASGSLYSQLDGHTQSIVKPFLTTRFTVPQKKHEAHGVVFGSLPHTFRRWLHMWLKQLATASTGPLSAALMACRGVASWDQPLMIYLLPFMMAEVAGLSEQGLQWVLQEVAAVMECAANGPEGNVSDIELYLQCIFTQLDLLSTWVNEQQELHEQREVESQQRAAAAAGNGTNGSRGSSKPSPQLPQLPSFVANVSSLVTGVPLQTMAQAALRCGAYARALQYYERHVRQVHGGGLNPAAYHGGCSSYTYDEVSFLLEVYGQLEEPDGLAGLVQLRQGGLTSTDQILVAEKAGAWSEALALYEQAVSQEAAENAASEADAAPGSAAGNALMLAARAVAAGQPLGMGGIGTSWVGPASDVQIPGLTPAVTGGLLLPGVVTAAAAANAVGVVLHVPPQGDRGGAVQWAQGCAAGGRAVSSLQVGQLRCLLQMGHHQTLLRQVDGLMARCLGGYGAAFGSSNHVAPVSGAADGGGGGGGSGTLAEVQWSMIRLAALGVAAAWRLGSWGVLRGYLSVLEAVGFSAGGRTLPTADQWELCVGSILEAMQRGVLQDAMAGVVAARAGVLGLLPAIAGESYMTAYPDLLKLHMLQEVEDACGLLRKAPSAGPLQRSLALRWPERLGLVAPLMSSREPLLALRRQLAGLLRDNDGMGQCWLQHAKLCRSTGHQEAAETSVLEAQARNVPGALLERCRLLWERDKGHRAILELQSVVQQQLEEDVPSDVRLQHQRAKDLLQLTEWISAVGQGDKELLIQNYDDVIALDNNWEKAHFSFACYLDQLYTDAKQREGKGAKQGQDRLGGRSRVKPLEDSPYDYLAQMLQHYGDSIRCGHKHILQSLPRLLTLYFEFGNKVAAVEAAVKQGQALPKPLQQTLKNAQLQVKGVMEALARTVPAYKWLLVLPQLTSRMCHAHSDVQAFMQALLGVIVDNFPQQALWAMAVVSKSTIRQRQEAYQVIIQTAKRRTNENGKRLFDLFHRLSDHLIRTCMWQPPSERRINRCSAKKEFSKLLQLLPVPVQVPVQALFTVDLPPSGKLPPGHRPVTNQATIAGMKDEVLIMNSLMKPKKITFIGSDGAEYPFLAKPKDDLRKDYRLMDFAGTLNALLARQPQAQRRGLSLRTYAVLPLTDDCGILQWVNNLVPFKIACEEIYVKEKIYRRGSTALQIKKMYDSFSGTRRADLLDSVLKLLPPRMSKWLLGRFSDPGTWLAARLAFTRSNAAWAMVGHVLGLGDRHGENIMINTLTGETMHVDFGCLFDRGLTLEVPEMVPFRLTQNVVDCFGVSGVEGVFRRAAEMTLQVLRDNKATLMTSAETFLHDPLVDWTKGSKSSSAAAAAASGAGLEHENPQAKDALLVMEGRLSGTLLGVASTPSLPLSCEGQAARLIAEASDHENLGRMYIWWMPWL